MTSGNKCHKIDVFYGCHITHSIFIRKDLTFGQFPHLQQLEWEGGGFMWVMRKKG